MRFFFSYSRSVKQDVGQVIDLLRAAGHDVWWDGDIPEIADWWATILDEIEQCQVFVFVVSEKSVQSAYCLEELRYATDRSRPILPFVIDDHTQYSIPPEVTQSRSQWLLHDGDTARTLQRIIDACDQINFKRYVDTPKARPLEPNKGGGTLIKEFQQAVSLAEDGHFAEAIKRFRNVMSLDFNEWGAECQQWIAQVQLYAEIAELADHKSTQSRARKKLETYFATYDADFDPFDVKGKLSSVQAASSQTVVVSPPLQSPALVVGAVREPPLRKATQAVINTIGEPFEWIHIKGGKVTLETGAEYTVPDFAIAKYALTNRQFQVFVDAKDGYFEAEWWNYSNEVREWRKQNNRPQDTSFKGDNLPRTNVCWYEAVAFTRWLSSRVALTPGPSPSGRGEITLPTEQQWQRAAVEDTGWAYPWGDDFDKSRVRFNTKSPGAVTDYPTGASPSGVLQMSGNVWEWCLTNYTNPDDQDIRANVRYRVLRGGSWRSSDSDALRAVFRNRFNPDNRNYYRGFRLAPSY